MRLRAKKGIGRYKSTKHYLDAVYRANKSLIDAKLPSTDFLSSKSLFKDWVRSYMREGKSLSQSIKTLSKSEIFVTRKERLVSNLFAGLRKDKEAFKNFRLSIGWKTKIDEKKMLYNSSMGGYFYVDKKKNTYLRIDPTSPKDGIHQKFKITRIHYEEYKIMDAYNISQEEAQFMLDNKKYF